MSIVVVESCLHRKLRRKVECINQLKSRDSASLTSQSCRFGSCAGALPDIVTRCCDLGRQWYTTNRESCTVYPSAVTGVQSSDRSACGSIIDVCCIAQRHEKQCSMGKQSARIRRSCDGLSSRPGSEQARVSIRDAHSVNLSTG